MPAVRAAFLCLAEWTMGKEGSVRNVHRHPPRTDRKGQNAMSVRLSSSIERTPSRGRKGWTRTREPLENLEEQYLFARGLMAEIIAVALAIQSGRSWEEIADLLDAARHNLDQRR